MDELVFVGIEMKTALLKFAKELGWPDYESRCEATDIVQMTLLSSSRKAMSVVAKLSEDHWRIYLKGVGVSPILARKYTRYMSSVRGAECDEEYKEIGTRDNVLRTITSTRSRC